MQAILGSGGAIGNELAKALKTYTDKVRLVSRNPKPVNEDDELLAADLTQSRDVKKAVEGAEVVYLTVGLPYNTKTWRSNWPHIMQNVIDACKANNSKLVFFDNIYMYNPDHLENMNEDTPVKPCSKKGKVRKEIAEMLINEMNSGDLDAIIARSADFYGPSIKNTSMLTEIVFSKLAKGKTAMWMGNATYKHSFTYTPDAAKATALLGNTTDVYNQIWHLPTALEPPTGKEWIALIAGEMNVRSKYRTISKFQLQLAGLFVPVMREMTEMLYQYNNTYVFDSSKFENRFNFKPTPYLEGIRTIIKTDY